MKTTILLLSFFAATSTFASFNDQYGVICETKGISGETIQLIQSSEHHFELKTSYVDGDITQMTSDSPKSSLWDGHHQGVITGEGFSLAYADDYGCINSVELVILQPGKNLQRVSFPSCKGASAPYCSGN